MFLMQPSSLNHRGNILYCWTKLCHKWKPLLSDNMPGVVLMVSVVGLGSEDPEFKSHSAVELIPGGVDSSFHPSAVGKMSASLMVSCVTVVTYPGLCPIAKETAYAAPMLCTEYGLWSQWMDGFIVG